MGKLSLSITEATTYATNVVVRLSGISFKREDSASEPIQRLSPQQNVTGQANESAS